MMCKTSAFGLLTCKLLEAEEVADGLLAAKGRRYITESGRKRPSEAK